MAKSRATETALLSLSDVSVTFGGLQALTAVDLKLASSEVVAVIGPNGAGKTTLFNSITGFVEMSSGLVALAGQQIGGLSPHEIAAKGVRRTFQNGGLCNSLTVLENILTGLHIDVHTSVIGSILGFPAARRAEKAAVSRARALLDLMGISHLEDQLAGTLSGGQLKMVEILRAIATNPPLLLLDEPAVGLALPVRVELAAIIRRLAKEEGIGILLIEHAIELVMDVSDRVVVLNNGEKIADDEPAAIRSDKAVMEAYLGHG